MADRAGQIGELYAEVGHLVLRRCLQILRNREEAMDVVQWTFVRALETGFEPRSRGEALSWLYRTAAHRCLWQMRNASHRSGIVDRHRAELVEMPSPAVEADVIGRELLVRALDGLSESAGQLVLMTYVWGYTNERAAEIAGTSVRTVGRARAAFEDRLRSLHAGEALA